VCVATDQNGLKTVSPREGGDGHVLKVGVPIVEHEGRDDGTDQRYGRGAATMSDPTFEELAEPALLAALELISAVDPSNTRLRQMLKHWHHAEADRLKSGLPPRPVDWAEPPYR
jgi:hypothetical protein